MLLSVPFITFSQNIITGKVYAAKDSTALNGVSVYYDGTSIGTSTNNNGFFSIKNYTGAPLIISFLGYEITMVQNLQGHSGELPPIYLKEKQEELAEVIVEPDPWSRKKKLQIFRREFLGSSSEAKKCRIKNEDALLLRYSPSTETLTAESTEPLIIVNRFLGYKISYDLNFCNIKFSTGTSGLRFTEMVLYEGFSYFEELRKRNRKKFIKNREQTYYGSSLHFMRALSNKALAQNDFRIFYDKFEVPPYKYFEFQYSGDLVRISLLAEKVSILYGELEQSGLQTTSPFYIDQFGNHTPPTSVIFSGEMSTKRAAHLLPLDYNIKF